MNYKFLSLSTAHFFVKDASFTKRCAGAEEEELAIRLLLLYIKPQLSC